MKKNGRYKIVITDTKNGKTLCDTRVDCIIGGYGIPDFVRSVCLSDCDTETVIDTIIATYEVLEGAKTEVLLKVPLAEALSILERLSLGRD